MRKLRCNRGFFKIVGLVIVAIWLCTIVAVIIGVGTLAKGNFWYTAEGAFNELKIDHPEATELLKDKRNIWGYSVITVMEAGQQKEYYLNTNVLWNYEFHAK